MWIDEGFTAAVIRDQGRDPQGLRDVLRFVRDDTFQTAMRVRHDVHPPLYYLLLNTWAWGAGHSDFSLRFFSACLMVFALTVTYQMTATSFGQRAGVIALILMGTSGFCVYYARESRMYALYLVWASLSSLAYLRWWLTGRTRFAILAGLFSTVLLYTHYTSFTLLIAQGIGTLLTYRYWHGRARLWQVIWLFGLPTIGFVPWLPLLREQLLINTQFTAPASLVSDGAFLMALGLILVSGTWAIFALPLLLSRRWQHLREHVPLLTIFILWLFVPVTLLFVINAYGLAVLQVRYLIVILPAWYGLVAYFLSDLHRFGSRSQSLRRLITVCLVIWIVYTQLATYRHFWAHKPDWRALAMTVAEQRQPLDPAILYLDERSPLRFYANQRDSLSGHVIHLNWRAFNAAETEALSAQVAHNDSVWVIGETQAPEIWRIATQLGTQRAVVRRLSVQGTIAYQFGTRSQVNMEDSLAFTFAMTGDDIHFSYRGALAQTHTAQVDSPYCLVIPLDHQSDAIGKYRIQVLATRGYHDVLATGDEPLSVDGEGTMDTNICLTIPRTGNFDLRLLIYPNTANTPLYVLEQGQLWGRYLLIGRIDVVSR